MNPSKYIGELPPPPTEYVINVLSKWSTAPDHPHTEPNVYLKFGKVIENIFITQKHYQTLKLYLSTNSLLTSPRAKANATE